MNDEAPKLGRPRPSVLSPSTLRRFIVSGAATAALFLAMSYGLTEAGLNPFSASLIAYAISFAIGYGLQRWWTFDGRHRHTSALPRYFVLQVGCALLSGLVSRQGVQWLGLSPLPMATLSTLVTGAVSFAVSRYWVFPHERLDPEQPV